ncbi:TauD/TfdA family dioxygenase [Streptomyces sp. HNM0574]|uniref:TauD/TfdA family dioxygenase n=1 Tax=Streptomyces sp. HNM0574 TaxID=2714954 RepID=UPI00146E99F1|nr:TauD/TfdA family dioxygenase [Streptomyces sp. HNM0574]NLU67788.1 taurine catabolism dioxygenase TauD [Streptomyces sp. HNM0574]
MPRLDTPAVYDLSTAELRDLEALLSDAAHCSPSDDPGSEAYYEQVRELAHRLPSGLRRFLRGLRSAASPPAGLIRGFGVDDAAIGPTPAHWREAAASPAARREERWLALLGLATGEPFAWSTLQRGRLIQNMLPIAGEEVQQSGHGQVHLEWHTEDAFHPHRCDHLILLGLRNHDATGTTLASVRDVTLGAEHRAVLAQKRFHILPDEEHLRQLARNDPHSPALARMLAMRDDPEPVAVLSAAPGTGSPEHTTEGLRLRIDPCYMRCLPGDTEAGLALKHLVEELESAQQSVALRPGEVLVVDNHRAVHGRQDFTARFDGTDRWLKKITVTGDPRRSRDLRAPAASRVIS